MPRLDARWSREAIAVAWKLHRSEYQSEDHALRALRRRCPGLGPGAPELLGSAREVLRVAIELVRNELTTYRRFPHMPGGITTAPELTQSREQLAARFPGYPATGRTHALERAFIYNVL